MRQFIVFFSYSLLNKEENEEYRYYIEDVLIILTLETKRKDKYIETKNKLLNIVVIW